MDQFEGRLPLRWSNSHAGAADYGSNCVLMCLFSPHFKRCGIIFPGDLRVEIFYNLRTDNFRVVQFLLARLMKPPFAAGQVLGGPNFGGEGGVDKVAS